MSGLVFEFTNFSYVLNMSNNPDVKLGFQTAVEIMSDMVYSKLVFMEVLGKNLGCLKITIIYFPTLELLSFSFPCRYHPSCCWRSRSVC